MLSQVVINLDNQVLDRQSSKSPETSFRNSLHGIADSLSALSSIVKVLTTFFTTKLADKPSLVSCTSALTHLTQSASFGTLEGLEVTRGYALLSSPSSSLSLASPSSHSLAIPRFHSVFDSINLKSHSQSIRHTVYVLLDSLMTHSRPALLRMKQEFVKGYCSLVEGEKDPRNLMISFGLIRVMLLEFEVEGVVEVSLIFP